MKTLALIICVIVSSKFGPWILTKTSSISSINEARLLAPNIHFIHASKSLYDKLHEIMKLSCF